MHPAKLLLRQDVKDEKHATMTPSELKSTRQEYKQFELVIFKRRIYQEVRRKKFFHYLELERLKARPAPRRTNEEFAARNNNPQSFSGRNNNQQSSQSGQQG
jgi:hypothetical protein